MAKQIKAIQCPKCGSINKTEIKPDYYKCDSCSTEYFLDNDDINVNYNYNTQKPQLQPFNRKSLLMFIGIVMAFVIGINVLSAIIGFFSHKNTSSPQYGAYSSSGSEKESGYEFSDVSFIGFENPQDQTPVGLMIASRTEEGAAYSDKKEVYAAFYDLIKNEELKSEKIDIEIPQSGTTNYKMETFDNGEIYAVLCESKIYKINKGSLSVEEITKKLYNFDALKNGVAKIEFVYDNYGNGFKILANDAQTYYFYPLANKLYNEKEFKIASTKPSGLIPSAKDDYYFSFTSESTEYKDEKLQLLKIKYKNNFGGPKDFHNGISWHDNYGGSGIFTDSDPHTKELVSEWQKEEGRIISYKDFTPNRNYFTPKTLWNNNSEVVILFKPDINPNTPFSIQCLDATTASIKWTYQNKDSNVSFLAKTPANCILLSSNSFILLDNKGGVVNTFKI